jgi:hypothetical protein
MRPWFIMASAAGIAVLMVGVFASYLSTPPIHSVDQSSTGPSSPDITGNQGSISITPKPVPMRTTVEEQDGIKYDQTGPDGNVPDQWATLGCVAILTAPKSMQVSDIGSVETTLLVAEGSGAIASLLKAAKDTQATINAGSPASSTPTHTGLDAASDDALRRMVDGNRNRQAAVDTLSGSPIMTVHLAGLGFEITPVTPERQALTGKQPGSWQWIIKALDPGPRTLTVSYSAEVKIAGQTVPQALRTLSRDVVVNVAPTALLKQVDETTKSVKSIAENVSWIWTTLIFPALMFLYGLRKWLRERHAHP